MHWLIKQHEVNKMIYPYMGCENCDCDLEFEHIEEWEEMRTRIIKRKIAIGNCEPTVEDQVFSTTPKIITIVARMSSEDKNKIWDCFKECAWIPLYEENNEFVDHVWIEEPNIRWDNQLGCGDKPWIVTLTLICSNS